MSVPYLLKRPASKNFYFRHPIPKDLQPYYDDKPDIVHSLNTDDKRRAEYLVAKCVVKLRDTFDVLRRKKDTEERRRKGYKSHSATRIGDIFVVPDYSPLNEVQDRPFPPITSEVVQDIVSKYRGLSGVTLFIDGKPLPIYSLPSHYNEAGELICVKIFSDGTTEEYIIDNEDDFLFQYNNAEQAESISTPDSEEFLVKEDIFSYPKLLSELDEMVCLTEMSFKPQSLVQQEGKIGTRGETHFHSESTDEPKCSSSYDHEMFDMFKSYEPTMLEPVLTKEQIANRESRRRLHETLDTKQTESMVQRDIPPEPEINLPPVEVEEAEAKEPETVIMPREACVLPVTDTNGYTLKQLYAAFLAEKQAQSRANKTTLSTKLENRYRISYECLAGFVGGEDVLISNIKRHDIRELRDLLIGMPTNLKKMPDTRNLTMKQVYEGIRDGTFKDMKLLSISSVNQHIETISAFFRYAVQEELLSKNPAESRGLSLQKKFASIVERDPYPLEMLSCLHTLSKGTEHELIIKLALFMGLRMNEIVQLRKEDIRQSQDGIWYVDINTQEGKQVKTKDSIRTVPIPDVLINEGFLLFVNTSLTETLFDVPRSKKTGYRSDIYSKRFRNFAKNRNLVKERCTFHSLRHNFRDYTREAELPESISKRLGGWAEEGVSSHYGSGYKLQQLKMYIDKVADLIVRDLYS